jgi:hypothetical protein
MKTTDLLDKLARLRYPWPFKILVTASVLYLVNKSLSKDQVPLLLNNISLLPVAAALALGCLSFYCQVRRWKVVLDAWGIGADLVAALRTMLWGCLLAFITPGRAGELMRGFSLPALKKGHTVYATIADKAFAGVTALVFGIICCFVALARNLAAGWGQRTVIIGSAAVLAVTGIFCALRSRPFINNILDNVPAFSPRKLRGIVLYSLASHILLLIQTAMLLSMFGNAGFIDNVLASGQAYAFMMFFPFFIANMGIREYSFALFSSHAPTAAGNAGYAGLSGIAFGASMGILVINIMLPALIGLVWWIIGKKCGSNN